MADICIVRSIGKYTGHCREDFSFKLLLWGAFISMIVSTSDIIPRRVLFDGKRGSQSRTCGSCFHDLRGRLVYEYICTSWSLEILRKTG